MTFFDFDPVLPTILQYNKAMETRKHYSILSRIYQGSVLFFVMLLSRLAPDTIVSINQQLDITFSNWESWLLIALNSAILFLAYHWGSQTKMLPSFNLAKKDFKAIIWGFLIIFLIGFIGSNLMLITNSVYHTSLQKTLTAVPILPQAATMLTASVLEEVFFRRWLFSWFKEASSYVVLVSTVLFCFYQLPSNIGHLFLYLGMGFALSKVYQKTQNSYANISLHILWNTYTLMMTILIIS